MQRPVTIRTLISRTNNLARSLTTMSAGREVVSAIFIGSGQAGTPLAVALANAGRSTVLIERSNLRGTCVNVGCTPTKTMIASGRIAHLAGRASEYGVFQRAVGEGIVPVAQMERIRKRKREIVQKWRSGSEKRVAGVKGLQVIRGVASFVGKKVVKIAFPQHEESSREIEAEEIFINVGERPAKSDLQGLETVDASRVLDSTSIMKLNVLPQRLLVLGGGYIGMEFGQLFARLKIKVTIVQRGKQLLPQEDAEIAQAVQDICKEDGIEVILSATATLVSTTGPDNRDILLEYRTTDGALHETSGSHILIATGRTPNTDPLNLSATSVETTSRDHITVSPDLRTIMPGVYALGDCHGGPAFTHVSYDDFRIIRATLIDTNAQTASTAQREGQVPYIVYTDPQLGHVGLHEAEARRKFLQKQIKTAPMPMSYVARAVETAETRGLMKAVVDGESGAILGFTCLGIEGGEIMSLVQVAMMGELPYWRLSDAVFAHPTLAESLNNLWGYLG
jgi:pyruvate/2-oxoglutarate dehydrogenase complex dihydrolipoamide dehydrogenase (E3) component